MLTRTGLLPTTSDFTATRSCRCVSARVTPAIWNSQTVRKFDLKKHPQGTEIKAGFLMSRSKKRKNIFWSRQVAFWNPSKLWSWTIFLEENPSESGIEVASCQAITMHQMKVLTPTTVATEEGTAPRVPLLKLMIESLSKQVTSHQKVGIYSL